MQCNFWAPLCSLLKYEKLVKYRDFPCENLYKRSANVFSDGPAFFQTLPVQLTRSFYSNMSDVWQE